MKRFLIAVSVLLLSPLLAGGVLYIWDFIKPDKNKIVEISNEEISPEDEAWQIALDELNARYNPINGIPFPELFKFSANGMEEHCFGPSTKIIIEERKRYFSEQGWKDYSEFIAALQSKLLEASNSEYPKYVEGYVDPKTVRVETISDNQKKLRATGMFGSKNIGFDVEVFYSIINEIGEVEIDQWKLTFQEDFK